MGDDFIGKLQDGLFSINIQVDGQLLGLSDYLALPPELRGDDERDVVDLRLTLVLLSCLGYTNADWQYNKAKENSRPDYRVLPEGRSAFFIENKRTSLPLRLDDLSGQLLRYLKGVVPHGFAFNGSELLVVRLDGGQLTPVSRVNVIAALGMTPTGSQLVLDSEAQKNRLQVFYELFRRERFVLAKERVKKLNLSETDWLKQARPMGMPS